MQVALRSISGIQPIYHCSMSLTDAMNSQDRERFGHKPRSHRRKARQQLLAAAKKKKPRINKIHKAIKRQGHLKQNLVSFVVLIACGGCLLAAGRHSVGGGGS